jgi:splicing factor 3B subunit 3
MIIMSFPTKTIVLTTTANGYSQTKDTGIDEATMSLHVGRLDDDSLVQIFPSGFRHIKTDKTAKTMKFEGKIVRGITKGKQMALALTGGDIIYYELDQTGSLSEVAQTSLEAEVVALDFSPIEKGRIRSNFLAVAFSDGTARIF